MSFNGNEGAFISLNDAAAMTANYRQGQLEPVLGYFYGSAKLSDLLSQDGCVGLRIYFGQDSETGAMQLVLVAADADENDILGTEPIILDGGAPCPSSCGNSNNLNS